ncbi:hypothetical protein IAU60_004484 [Kwoniella sp. DSM 27419]
MSDDPPSTPSSSRANGQEHEPLLPSTSTPFAFTCKCTNVRVNGRIPNNEKQLVREAKRGAPGGDLLKVFLPSGAETIKLSGYVTYDQDDFSGSAPDSAAVDGDTLGPSWRKCWLCDTKCYRANGKDKHDVAAQEEWVAVRFDDGILFGDQLDQIKPDSLVFSNLQLEGPTGTSNFGRPPAQSTPSLYPGASTSPKGKPQHLIPPPHDPFFLPPPFIPSHPQLRDLCNSAGDFLREAHSKAEEDVKHYIHARAQAMRELEEKVRAEVEMLWDKYRTGPGQGENVERRRSVSASRSGELSRPISKDRSVVSPSDPDDNPIAKAATSPGSNAQPPASSLLAQSLSANTFYAPPPATTAPPSVKDEVQKTLDQVAKTYGKQDDNRAVAMSYVLSNLGEHMGGGASSTANQTRRRSSSASNGHALPDKDSWIDEERMTLSSAGSAVDKMSVVEEENAGKTPKPKAAGLERVDKEPDVERTKGRGKVTFEEPKAEREIAPQEGSNEEPELEPEEDTVFEMEMDDGPAKESQSKADSASDPVNDLPASRSKDLVEANLSRTFAADAPSHRAAWKRISEKGSMYATLRRGSNTSDTDEDPVDESSISKLAMSMPMAIHLPKAKTRKAEVPEFERKTSLSERQGLLVPPLLKAMRERGMPQDVKLGVTPSRGRPEAAESMRRTSRQESVSREREQVKSYAADPGAVFESLADEGDDDEEGDAEDGGTLRDTRGFMPPHVLARKE